MDCETFVRLNAENKSIRGKLEGFSDQADLPRKLRFELQIVLDELVANIRHHGYRGSADWRVDIRLRLHGDMLEIETTDGGPPFDITQAKPPSFADTLEDTEVGGLGIHIVHQLMDRIEYARRGEENHLRMAKRLAAS